MQLNDTAFLVSLLVLMVAITCFGSAGALRGAGLLGVEAERVECSPAVRLGV